MAESLAITKELLSSSKLDSTDSALLLWSCVEFGGIGIAPLPCDTLILSVLSSVKVDDEVRLGGSEPILSCKLILSVLSSVKVDDEVRLGGSEPMLSCKLILSVLSSVKVDDEVRLGGSEPMFPCKLQPAAWTSSSCSRVRSIVRSSGVRGLESPFITALNLSKVRVSLFGYTLLDSNGNPRANLSIRSFSLSLRYRCRAESG
jgi:hypothetical protein